MALWLIFWKSKIAFLGFIWAATALSRQRAPAGYYFLPEYHFVFEIETMLTCFVVQINLCRMLRGRTFSVFSLFWSKIKQLKQNCLFVSSFHTILQQLFHGMIYWSTFVNFSGGPFFKSKKRTCCMFWLSVSFFIIKNLPAIAKLYYCLIFPQNSTFFVQIDF